MGFLLQHIDYEPVSAGVKRARGRGSTAEGAKTQGARPVKWARLEAAPAAEPVADQAAAPATMPAVAMVVAPRPAADDVTIMLAEPPHEYTRLFRIWAGLWTARGRTDSTGEIALRVDQFLRSATAANAAVTGYKPSIEECTRTVAERETAVTESRSAVVVCEKSTHVYLKMVETAMEHGTEDAAKMTTLLDDLRQARAELQQAHAELKQARADLRQARAAASMAVAVEDIDRLLREPLAAAEPPVSKGRHLILKPMPPVVLRSPRRPNSWRSQECH